MAKILETIRLIKRRVRGYDLPSVSGIAVKKDPYRVLISCILSLRTKDKTTVEASNRLFAQAANPSSLIKLSRKKLEKLIYPVGFYRKKAKIILEVSRKIINDFAGRVPGKLDDIISFKGVGRKTANLVLGLGFGIPAICVDTHVHRISNRLGWVRTNSPEETEAALKKIIPKDKWIGLNTWLVAFGQNLCLPVSPFCSRCPAYRLCARRGVVRSR